MPQQGQSKGNPIQDYITVAERVESFYRKFPEGRIITHIVEHDAERGFILMRAEVYRSAEDVLPAATGHAFELKTEGYVQRTSYIEVCETSCVGRGLAMAGFEVKRGIASREEMEKVARIEREEAARPQPQGAAPARAAPGRGSKARRARESESARDRRAETGDTQSIGRRAPRRPSRAAPHACRDDRQRIARRPGASGSRRPDHQAQAGGRRRQHINQAKTQVF